MATVLAEVGMVWRSGSSKDGGSSAFRVMAMALAMATCNGAWANPDEGRRLAVPADVAAASQSAAVQSTAAWATNAGDNQGLPFVIVDKVAAMLYVFDADGRPRASTTVLLGQAYGDHSVPGIGERRIADIRPHERTTPTGRFIGEPGRNLEGESIVWIDYDVALAIHRLRPGAGYQQRLRRMASASPDDKRASYGCVVVPVRFFEHVIAPMFARSKAMVYVLPETSLSTASLFNLARR